MQFGFEKEKRLAVCWGFQKERNLEFQIDTQRE
jgi:hypothetical protein